MRNFIYMGVTTAIRLGFGLLTFVFMARMLGAADFGVVMTALAVAVIVGLVPNFGFANYVLREIGAAPENANQVLSESLTAKILLASIVIICVALAYPWIGQPLRGVFAWMMLAQLADAFTDLLNVGFRATGRYNRETQVATVSSIVQCVFVAGVLSLFHGPIAAAIAYSAARVSVLSMTWLWQRQFFSNLSPAGYRKGIARLREAYSYAIDFGLQSMFGQVDSIVLAHFLGPAAVGVYQAGMRIFLAASQAASVLGNVFIPSVSRAHVANSDIKRVTGNMQLAFISIGFIGATVLILFPDRGVVAIFGNEYASLAGLLPLFGILFLARFIAAAWGILLTATGRQGMRAFATVAQWSLIAIFAFWLVPEKGAVGWLYCLILANILLSIGYLVVLWLQERSRISYCLPYAFGSLGTVIVLHAYLSK
jgi:O-antigen/teichoic acid export membrane protein